MKRILVALLMAVGIHGLLFGMEWGWLKRSPFEKPRQRPISLKLAIRQPQIPIQKVADKPLPVPAKPPNAVPVSPKTKTTSIAAKPKQQKHRKPTVQSREKTVPVSVPKTEAKSSPGLQPAEIKHEPQASANEGISAPEEQTVIEARPLYRSNPPPEYPAMARRRGYAGQVVLDVLVGRDGTVIDLRLFDTSGYDILDKAAIAAVKTWMFEPGMRGSKTMDMWVRVPIRFELK